MQVIEIQSPEREIIELWARQNQIEIGSGASLEVLVIDSNECTIEVSEGTRLEILEVAVQGPPGPPSISALRWIDYLTMPSTAVAPGVFRHTGEHGTVWRRVPDPYDPVEDAFYAAYQDGEFSGLLVRRG